jgi:CRP/FNR family transcriptional regulator, cyclic AMP receptor protein
MKKVLYILSILADEDVDWMAVSGKIQTVPGGTVLVREGQAVDSLYLLVDGSLRVEISQLKPRVVGVLGPGEIIGEISFVDSRPASATVIAETPANILRIPRETVNVKLKSDVHFAARFYRAIAVFMAHRLRRQTVGVMGYGDTRDLDEDFEAADELSPEILDELALAGARTAWILNKLKAQ